MKKLIFFGDSTTDMYRSRDVDKLDKIYGLGYGHVLLIASELKSKYPNEYQIINKGISGNRTIDLFNRYQEDVIDEKPDVLSILVGINDVYHELPGKRLSLKGFIEVYSSMINDIKEKLPKTKIIIMEPFMLKGDATIDNYDFFSKAFIKYIREIRRIAKEHNCYFVPLQKHFEKAIEDGLNPKELLYDGVHPNIVGISLIAREWLKAFKKISK